MCFSSCTRKKNLPPTHKNIMELVDGEWILSEKVYTNLKPEGRYQLLSMFIQDGFVWKLDCCLRWVPEDANLYLAGHISLPRLAIINKSIESLKIVLENGASTDVPDLFTNSSLIDYCLDVEEDDNSPGMRIRVRNMIQLLLHHEVDINAKSYKLNRTVLHRAAARSGIDMVSFLIANGASPFNRDCCGEYPIHHAVVAGDFCTVLELLKHHRSPEAVNSENNSGYTLLHYACNNGHSAIVDHLLKQPNIEINRLGGVVEGAIVQVSPLHLAAGKLVITKMLLEHPNTDVNIRDSHGETALADWYHCYGVGNRQGHTVWRSNVAVDAFRKEGIRLLFKHGASMFCVNTFDFKAPCEIFIVRFVACSVKLPRVLVKAFTGKSEFGRHFSLLPIEIIHRICDCFVVFLARN